MALSSNSLGSGGGSSGGGLTLGQIGSGNYTPEQLALLRRQVGNPGQDATQAIAAFGGDMNAYNRAINDVGGYGNNYDPNANANAYRANSPQGRFMQAMGWADANGNVTDAGRAGTHPANYDQIMAQYGGGGDAQTASPMSAPTSMDTGANPFLPAGTTGSSGSALSATPTQNFGSFDPNARPSGDWLSGTPPAGTPTSMPTVAGPAGWTGPSSPNAAPTGPLAQPTDATASLTDASPSSAIGAGPTIPTPVQAPGNYTGGMTMADYVNPMAQWATDQGLRKLKSAYAGAGDFLSGNALRGISDYTTNSAINNSWQPAFQNYMTDKGFNYGVDSADRQFAADQANLDRQFNYNVATGNRQFDYTAQQADRTYQQQIADQLAQLGLSGTQGAAGANNTLALLLAQLAQSGGVAAGTGTIGGTNAITNAISQILAQLNQQNILNSVFPNRNTGSGGLSTGGIGGS